MSGVGVTFVVYEGQFESTVVTFLSKEMRPSEMREL